MPRKRDGIVSGGNTPVAQRLNHRLGGAVHQGQEEKARPPLTGRVIEIEHLVEQVPRAHRPGVDEHRPVPDAEALTDALPA